MNLIVCMNLTLWNKFGNPKKCKLHVTVTTPKLLVVLRHGSLPVVVGKDLEVCSILTFTGKVLLIKELLKLLEVFRQELNSFKAPYHMLSNFMHYFESKEGGAPT